MPSVFSVHKNVWINLVVVSHKQTYCISTVLCQRGRAVWAAAIIILL